MTMQHHAVIAGSGRAGTTFLVEFLAACGLDVGDAGDDDRFFTRAQAGRETALDGPRTELPYVIKDPWLFTYCNALDLGDLRIDALILPMRDIRSAAASRIHQERLQMLDAGWLNRGDQSVFGMTAGGVIYSLKVTDQARILATGFHELLHWAVLQEIPVFLPAFPRMVTDGEYLITTLAPWLLERCSLDVARRAFAESVRPDAVHRYGAGEQDGDPDGRADSLEAQVRALSEGLIERTEQVEAGGGREIAAQNEIHRLNARLLELQDDARRAAQVADAQAHALGTELHAATESLNTVFSSRSWRLTWPLRRRPRR